MQNNKLAYRVSEVAELLSISRATAYGLVQKGILPTVRIGGILRVPHLALEGILAEQPGSTEGRAVPITTSERGR